MTPKKRELKDTQQHFNSLMIKNITLIAGTEGHLIKIYLGSQ